jgi:zinc transporter ZupT
MNTFYQLAIASLLGLGTTSSSILGVAIGLYVPFSKRPLACLLAFAAGSLISALAIELAYEGAQSLHHQGFNAHAAWAFVSAGFAAGAIIYYSTSLFLEKNARDVSGWNPRSRSKRIHADQGGLPPRRDLRSLVDSAGCRGGRRRGRKGFHRQQRRINSYLCPGAGGRRRARTGRPCHDSGSPGRRRLAGGAAEVAGFLFALYLALAESFV